MKQKLKNYSFWVGLVASIMLVVKFVAENFGFKIDENLINNLVNSILGVLTVLGVINNPTKTNTVVEDVQEESVISSTDENDAQNN